MSQGRLNWAGLYLYYTECFFKKIPLWHAISLSIFYRFEKVNPFFTSTLNEQSGSKTCLTVNMVFVTVCSGQKCPYFLHSCGVFFKKITVSISGKNPIYNISSIGKKHLVRGFMCFPYHVSEVKNLKNCGNAVQIRVTLRLMHLGWFC